LFVASLQGEEQEPYHYLLKVSINKHARMEAAVKEELMEYASTKLLAPRRYMRAGAVASNFPAAKAEFEQRCALLCCEYLSVGGFRAPPTRGQEILRTGLCGMPSELLTFEAS
jgi:hypothetical protein